MEIPPYWISMDTVSVLCIDDDPVIQTLVKEVLNPWKVNSCLDLESVRLFFQKSQKIDALILDINLPDGDGLRFLNQQFLKLKEDQTVVFMISGHNDISKKMMAFEFGADDFLTKPFDPLELKIRLKSKIKKLNDKRRSKKIGDVIIDSQQFKAIRSKDGQSQIDLQLTTIEMKILILLTDNIGHVFTRNQIMDKVWGNVAITDRTVDSHVAHLRKKLSTTELKINTTQNLGYSATHQKTLTD